MRKKYIKHKKSHFRINFLLIIFLIFAVIKMPEVYSANCNNLKFAQISDAHFSNYEKNTSYKMLEDSAEILDDAISQVNSTPKINFVMFSGDLINQPYEKQLTAFIKHANNLSVPWYAIYGNHDISIDGYLNKRTFFDIINAQNYNFHETERYYSFIPKRGYKVIALDTTIDNEITTQGIIDETQLAWLDNELKSAKNSVIIIFMHVPIKQPYPSENHSLRNAAEVLSVLNKYSNPMIICSGHYHSVKVFKQSNKLFIASPSLVTYPNAFRIVNINSQKNKIIVDLYLRETRLEEVQMRAKLRILGSKMLYGEESDRNATYELKR